MIYMMALLWIDAWTNLIFSPRKQNIFFQQPGVLLFFTYFSNLSQPPLYHISTQWCPQFTVKNDALVTVIIVSCASTVTLRRRVSVPIRLQSVLVETTSYTNRITLSGRWLKLVRAGGHRYALRTIIRRANVA